METYLHKIKEGFILTSDEEIKEGDIQWFLHNNNIKIASEEYGIHPDCQKVIAQQDQIDFSKLSLEDQKKIGWFNIDELALKLYPVSKDTRNNITRDTNITQRRHFIEMFPKVQELLSDRMFTLEDMRAMYDISCGKIGMSGLLDQTENQQRFNLFLKSIDKTSWEVEIEMDSKSMERRYSDNKWVESDFVPKITDGKIKILKLLK